MTTPIVKVAIQYYTQSDPRYWSVDNRPLQNINTNLDNLITTVNSMSTAAGITGGSIDGTTIGFTTPSTGAFSTLTSSGVTKLGITSGNILVGTSVDDGINKLQVNGNTKITGVINTNGYTVATLPAGTLGMRAYVTDATAPTYLGALTGGGTVKCPVFYNGTAWVSA